MGGGSGGKGNGVRSEGVTNVMEVCDGEAGRSEESEKAPT